MLELENGNNHVLSDEILLYGRIKLRLLIYFLLFRLQSTNTGGVCGLSNQTRETGEESF